MASASRFQMLAAETEAAIRLGREALSMMEELGGDEEGRAFVLNNIGSARVRAGDARRPRRPRGERGDQRGDQLRGDRPWLRQSRVDRDRSRPNQPSREDAREGSCCRRAIRHGRRPPLAALGASLGALLGWAVGRGVSPLGRADRRSRSKGLLDGDAVPLVTRSHQAGSGRPDRRRRRPGACDRASAAREGPPADVAGPFVWSSPLRVFRRRPSDRLHERAALRVEGACLYDSDGKRLVG